jgi:hypothetical protein
MVEEADERPARRRGKQEARRAIQQAFSASHREVWVKFRGAGAGPKRPWETQERERGKVNKQDLPFFLPAFFGAAFFFGAVLTLSILYEPLFWIRYPFSTPLLRPLRSWLFWFPASKSQPSATRAFLMAASEEPPRSPRPEIALMIASLVAIFNVLKVCGRRRGAGEAQGGGGRGDGIHG